MGFALSIKTSRVCVANGATKGCDRTSLQRGQRRQKKLKPVISG